VYSLIIPVYKNEGSIPDLIEVLKNMNKHLGGDLETVLVVDGSPDKSYARLRELLPLSGLKSKLVLLSRNFGSFAAIRTGLQHATGEYFGVMAADLQEPPELVQEFFSTLRTEPFDVVIGTREARADPLLSSLSSRIFWACYKKFVVPEMPWGGVDVFGCNKAFRNQLLQLEESHSSLIAQLFWLGFRRKLVSYTRQLRKHGKTAWTFRKKLTYLMDSVFAFSDLPIRLLIGVGGGAFVLSVILACVVLVGRFLGWVSVPGYAATMLVVLFFGTLNLLSLGLIGSYAWRTYENTKQRPLAIPMRVESFDAHDSSTKG
jgi:polyisoprenyl-phosphate glycosyltransferase